jgi:hypothetical protein
VTDDPDDGLASTPEEIDEAFDLAADAALDWWRDPTDVSLFYLGVACVIEGFASRYVLDAAAKHLAQLAAEGELDIPEGVDPFRLADLVKDLYAPGDDG